MEGLSILKMSFIFFLSSKFSNIFCDDKCLLVLCHLTIIFEKYTQSIPFRWKWHLNNE